MATRHADGRNSIKHGSGRVAGLARWLGKLPDDPTFDTLCLEVKSDGEWSRLQTWPRSDVVELLADPIDALCQELANEVGAYTHFRCAWWSSQHEKYWTSRDLRVHPDVPEGADVTQMFSGDPQSVMIATQRHLEKMVATHVGGFQQAMNALKTSNEQLSNALEKAHDELESLRAHNAKLQSENAQLAQVAEQATDMYEEAAKKIEELDKNSNVVNIAQAALLKNLGVAPAA